MHRRLVGRPQGPEIAAELSAPDVSLREKLLELGERAVVAHRCRQRQHLGRRAALAFCHDDVPAAARPMRCARSPSRAGSPGTPKARCWSRSATHRCCARPASRTACPPFLRGKEQGWVTAEYGMLPRSTHTRSAREAARGKQSGRTQEIQRLIGRSLRAVVDLKALGERTITLDCDVLQADGGTRTASITGGYVALAQACERLRRAAHDRGEPAARRGRGGLGRHRRRRAGAGPGLRARTRRPRPT